MTKDTGMNEYSFKWWVATFAIIMVLVIWNATKLPFVMAYDPEGEWAKAHGFPASINAVFWITSHGGFQAAKMKSPAANFFLVHMFFGITCLSMIAATLVNGSLRKRWGYITLTFGFLLGLHSLPASDRSKFWPIFVPDCMVMLYTSVWGIYILYNYPKTDLDKQKKAEEKLEQIHYAQAFGAWGAGFAELGTNIIPSIINLVKNGEWKRFPDKPVDEVGTTIYDFLPESVGYNFFLFGCFLFWMIIPMHLLTEYMKNPKVRHTAAPKVDTPFETILKRGLADDWLKPYLVFFVGYYIFKIYILKTNLFLPGKDAGVIFGPNMDDEL